MFYSIKGTLILCDPAYAVLSCGGVGFKCYTTTATQNALPPLGSEVTLYTYLYVREDALDLYGFYAKSELDCFKTLIGVSGVGQKVGLAILSVLPAERVALAIASGDHKALTAAPGVGPKLAQRIVLELKDKLGAISLDGPPVGSVSGGVPSAASHAAEAVKALQMLGYSPSDANGAVAKLDSALPVEELIRLALRQMAGRL